MVTSGLSTSWISKLLKIKGGITVTTKWLYWFDELCMGDIGLVGKKCANLGEMTKAKVSVPPGYALSLEAYQRFMRETGLTAEITGFLKRYGDEGPKGYGQFMEASHFIKELMEAKEMPADMAALIKENYRKLCAQCGIEDVAVAVRSSGPVSLPGAFETYLNVKGEDDVVKHIIKVWASTFTVQAIGHRVNQHHPMLIDGIGVAILKMVKAKTAGVAFTMHPTTMDDTKIVIEGTWGLGESVVGGGVSPDRIVVDKNTREVEQHINAKLKQVVYQEKGTQVIDVPEELRNVPCLGDEEIRRLVDLALSVEKYYGVAQDIEWVFDADMDPSRNLFLVQARNISVVKEKKKDVEQIADLMLRRVFQRRSS